MSLEVLFLRRPKIDYVSPPVCEGSFFGTGTPIIVLEPFGARARVTGLVLTVDGDGFRLSWNAFPGALCYNVYEQQEDGSWLLVAECIPDLFFFSLSAGPFAVTAITDEGETELSDPSPLPPGPPPPPCEKFVDNTHTNQTDLPPTHGNNTPEGLITGFRNIGGFQRPWAYENRSDSDLRTEISSGEVQASQSASTLVNTDGSNFFQPSHVGKWLRYDSGGARVQIVIYISPTQVQVDTSQTVALSTFKIQGSTLGGNRGLCSRANSVAGVIAGLETTPDELADHLFWFNKTTGEMRDLGSTDGIGARALVDSGHLLYVDNPGFAGFRSFIYNPLTQLSTPLTHPNTVLARAMNNSLTVTGAFETAGENHAFRWAAGTFTDIHPPDAHALFDSSSGNFITPSGTIFGEYFENVNGNVRVFINTGGVSQSIGDFGLVEDINLRHVNANGVAIGSGGPTGGWIWNGTMNLIPDFGGAQLHPSAINSLGWVVGFMAGLRCFVHLNGITHNLIDLFPPGHGWTNLFFAHWITDEGEISGVGTLGGVATPFFCKLCL